MWERIKKLPLNRLAVIGFFMPMVIFLMMGYSSGFYSFIRRNNPLVAQSGCAFYLLFWILLYLIAIKTKNTTDLALFGLFQFILLLISLCLIGMLLSSYEIPAKVLTFFAYAASIHPYVTLVLAFSRRVLDSEIYITSFFCLFHLVCFLVSIRMPKKWV